MARSRAKSRRFIRPPAADHLRHAMIANSYELPGLRIFVPGVALLAVSVAASPASAHVDYEARQRTRQLPIARAAARSRSDGGATKRPGRPPPASDFLQNEPNDGVAGQRAHRCPRDLRRRVSLHRRRRPRLGAARRSVSDLKKDFDPSTSDAFEVISGRRCRASARSPACRAPGPSKGCAASGPATICG